MAHSVVFCAAIVLEHQHLFCFQMPDGIVKSSCSIAHTTLRARAGGRLEQLVERYHACMAGITVPDRTANSTNRPSTDTDTSLLANVFDHCAGSGIDAVKAVACFNQYTATELTLRCAHACHDRCGQADVVPADCIVIIMYHIQSSWLIMANEQRGCDQRIGHLRSLFDLTCHAILYQILAAHLLHGHIG